MKRYTTKGIILNRTNFGEADRILTFLTNSHGKIRAIAKGVRKSKAKLAGSVELFSVTDLTLIAGRSEIDTLVSARLTKHYGNIVKDIERTKLAYDFLKIVGSSTQDRAEPEYFELLKKSLSALDSSDIEPKLTELWFQMQLLKLGGHTPNLKTDNGGNKLKENQMYNFNLGKMCFTPNQNGRFGKNDIKLLRLCLSQTGLKTIARIMGNSPSVRSLNDVCERLVSTMRAHYLGGS